MNKITLCSKAKAILFWIDIAPNAIVIQLRAELAKHVDGCEQCKKYYKKLQKEIAAQKESA